MLPGLVISQLNPGVLQFKNETFTIILKTEAWKELIWKELHVKFLYAILLPRYLANWVVVAWFLTSLSVYKQDDLTSSSLSLKKRKS